MRKENYITDDPIDYYVDGSGKIKAPLKCNCGCGEITVATVVGVSGFDMRAMGMPLVIGFMAVV